MASEIEGHNLKANHNPQTYKVVDDHKHTKNNDSFGEPPGGALAVRADLAMYYITIVEASTGRPKRIAGELNAEACLAKNAKTTLALSVLMQKRTTLPLYVQSTSTY